MSGYIGSTPVVTQVDGYNRTEADAEFVDVTGVTIYGSQAIPKPSTQEGYIDLSVLLDMPEEEKRTTVLGWAELIAPGFVEEKEQAVAQKLQAKLDEPARSSVSVL